MAKLLRLPSLAIIDGFKGSVDFYVHRGIVCARAWPRSPGHRRAQAVEARWPAFTVASRLWNQLSPEVRQAYGQMSAGLRLSARDIFIKGYLKSDWPHLE
ncbi:hypothetical protein ES708_10711 [subsurface metagenome]